VRIARKILSTSERWKRHKAKWSCCMSCGLHKTKTNYVFGRGKLPADILMIGEAPGETEDLTGKPFCGRAGQLLNKAIEIVMAERSFTYFITNLVACRPTSGGYNRQPTQLEVMSCRPRLIQIVEISKAKTVIALGRLPSTLGLTGMPKEIYWCELRHPAYILRRGGEGSDEFQNFVRKLAMYVKIAKEGHPLNENQKTA